MITRSKETCDSCFDDAEHITTDGRHLCPRCFTEEFEDTAGEHYYSDFCFSIVAEK